MGTIVDIGRITSARVIHPGFSGIVQKGHWLYGVKEKGRVVIPFHIFSLIARTRLWVSFLAFTRKFCIKMVLNSPDCLKSFVLLYLTADPWVWSQEKVPSLFPSRHHTISAMFLSGSTWFGCCSLAPWDLVLAYWNYPGSPNYFASLPLYSCHILFSQCCGASGRALLCHAVPKSEQVRPRRSAWRNVLAFSSLPPVSNPVSPTLGIQCYQVDYLFTSVGKYKSIKTIVYFHFFFKVFVCLFFLLKWQFPYAHSPLSSLSFPLLLLPVSSQSLSHLSSLDVLTLTHSGSLLASVFLCTPSLIPVSAALGQSSCWGQGI